MELIEVHAVHHCDLGCVGCSHFAPLAKPWYADPDRLRDDLTVLGRLTDVKVVRLMGGEPTLHPRLGELIAAAHAALPNAEIRVHSNGANLFANMGHNLEDVVNYGVTMEFTKYPGIDYERIAFNLRMINVPMIFYPRGEVRVVMRHHMLTHDLVNHESNHDCVNLEGDSMQLVEGGYLYLCPLQAYAWIFNEYFGESYHVDESLRLDLRRCTSTDVRNFKAEHNEFCRHCAVPKEEIPWRRSSRRIEEWT